MDVNPTTASELFAHAIDQRETKEIQSDGLALAIFRATDFLHVAAPRSARSTASRTTKA